MSSRSVLVWAAADEWGRGTQPRSRPRAASWWRPSWWSRWSPTWTGWSRPGPPPTTTTLRAGTSMITSDVMPMLGRVLRPSSWWSLVIWGWALTDLEPLMKVPRHKTWKIVVYCLPNWSSSSVLLLSTKDKVAVGIIKKNLSKIFVRVFCKISVTFCCLFSILVLPMLELYQIFPLNIVWILLLMLEFLIYFLFFI